MFEVLAIALIWHGTHPATVLVYLLRYSLGESNRGPARKCSRIVLFDYSAQYRHDLKSETSDDYRHGTVWEGLPDMPPVYPTSRSLKQVSSL